MQENRLQMLIDLAERKVSNTLPGVAPKRLLIYRYPSGQWVVREVESDSVNLGSPSNESLSLEKALEDYILWR